MALIKRWQLVYCDSLMVTRLFYDNKSTRIEFDRLCACSKIQLCEKTEREQYKKNSKSSDRNKSLNHITSKNLNSPTKQNQVNKQSPEYNTKQHSTTRQYTMYTRSVPSPHHPNFTFDSAHKISTTPYIKARHKERQLHLSTFKQSTSSRGCAGTEIHSLFVLTLEPRRDPLGQECDLGNERRLADRLEGE